MVRFRGKTEKGNEVKGWLLKLLDGSIIIVSEAAKTTKDHPHYPAVSLGIYSEVIPSTIAQFTDLKDKNNVEIYGSIPIDGKMSKGGDIMRTHNPCQSKEAYAKDPYTYSVVVWDRRNACFRGCFGEEIIGNQTDNKDLLK